MTTKPDASSDGEAAATEKRPQDWNPKEPIKFELEADGLADQELGELLRRRGVHREQLDAWRALADAFRASRDDIPYTLILVVDQS